MMNVKRGTFFLNELTNVKRDQACKYASRENKVRAAKSFRRSKGPNPRLAVMKGGRDSLSVQEFREKKRRGLIPKPESLEDFQEISRRADFQGDILGRLARQEVLLIQGNQVINLFL